MSLNSIRNILIALSIFVFGWGLGGSFSGVNLNNIAPSLVTGISPLDAKQDMTLFWDVWNRVSQSFIDKKSVDPKKMVYGAISGMVSSLGDPYTVFLTPDQNKESKEELGGAFDGIGAQLGIKDKKIVVIAPLKGTPAEKAGLKPYDWIVKINGKDTFALTLPEAVSQIRGKKGTTVKLTIYSAVPKVNQANGNEPITSPNPSASPSVPEYNLDSKPAELEIVRDTILVKSVEVDYKDMKNGKKAAVVKLSRFGDDTNSEWDKVVLEVARKYSSGEVSGMVLDLRNNPGGYLNSSIYIASDFLKGGKVSMVENSKGVKQDFAVDREGKLLNIPLTVLINGGSASASEIVAGALQDRGRAKVVGEQSFGKGSVQEVQELEGGAGLHITTSKWLLPSGKWINGTGLTPNVKVDAGSSSDKDPQLDRAIELLSQ